MNLMLNLDREAQEPLYQQIKRHILKQIDLGLLTAGDRLPPTRDLAEQLQVARISVVAAYEELKSDGVITTAVGRGTFIADHYEAPEAHPSSTSHVGAMRSQNAALRDLLGLAARPGIINFSTGAPAEDFLPVNLIREAINTVLVRDGASAVAYESTEGYPLLREAIAASLRTQSINISAGDLLITGGCQQALDLAVQALVGQGEVILTASPTYAGLLDIAQARGMVAVGVPVDQYGMQTEALEGLIAEHRPRLIYAAPTYQNPTGTVMPLYRRRQLLDIAAHYHIPILEDGVYEGLSYSGTVPPSLKALETDTENGLVLYASSYSKIFLPGMRVGFLAASRRLHARLARVKRAADVCTPALNQRAMHVVLESGALWDHLSYVQKQCRIRRAAMLDALKRFLPEAVWHEPSGGLYVWVRLPEDGPTSTELYLEAVKAGAAFAMGPLFYPDGRGAHHLRLNFTAQPPELIEQGVHRLGSAWRILASEYRRPEESARTPLL